MTTVVSVRFRSGCKTYFFDPRELTVEAGQDIIVETAQGPEFAQCSQGNHEVPDQQVVQPLRAVFRDSAFATDAEKINVTEIFKNLSPDTKVKVI